MLAARSATPARALGRSLTRWTSVMAEPEFHGVADRFLHALEESLDELLEDAVDDLDISHAQGVLTLRLGDVGTFVINKQTPNRQLWWSSPISGPKRYEYDAASKDWLNTRDGSPMLRLLSHELHQLVEVETDFQDVRDAV